MYFLYKKYKKKQQAKARRAQEEHENINLEAEPLLDDDELGGGLEEMRLYDRSGHPTTLEQLKVLLKLQLKSDLRAYGWIIAKFLWPAFLLWFNNSGFSVTLPTEFNWINQFFQGFYMMLVLLAFALLLSIPVVEEYKEEIRRGLFLMGVRPAAYWGRFYLWSILSAVIGGLILIPFTLITNMWSSTNGGIVAISLLLTTLQMVPFTTCICIVSKRHMHSVFISLSSLIVQCLIYLPIFNAFRESPTNAQNKIGAIMAILGSGSAAEFQWGQIYLSETLATGETIGRGGVQFSNAWDYGIILSWIMQLISMALWSLLCMYLIRPSKMQVEESVDMDSVIPDKQKFEALSEGAKVSVSVRGLVKSFDGATTAVNGLNMDICENEVFGFLGHNGAGKSTTVSMMSCEFLQTSGSISYKFLDGSSATTGQGDDDLIKSRIGVCPQRDFLFKRLTCREHLELYARLKGNVPIGPGETFNEAVSNQAERLIQAIKFTSKADEDRRVGEYSGGMKRKVSIAVAMLGAPDVLYLDEPTAGMDPFNRRRVWDLITRFRKSCSIVLTTHFMDEADILSDRIGVINNGKLVTCGTSLFLKHQFGAGYTLSFAHSDNQEASIKAMVPSAKFDFAASSSTGKETYHWMVPYGNEHLFGELLETLEKQDVENLSLTNTTLEQVFLKTGAETADESTGLRKKDSSRILMESPEAKDDLADRIWNRKGLEGKPTYFKRMMAASDLTMISWWWIAGSLYFVVYPLMFAVIGFVLWYYLDATPGVPISIPAALLAWMDGMVVMPIISLVRDIAQLKEKDFFNVLKLMGASRASCYFGVVGFRGLLLLTVSYPTMVIISLIVGSPLTATFAGWLVFTIVYVLMMMGWTPWVGLISSFMQSAKAGMALASVIGYIFNLILFAVIFITGINDGVSDGVVYGLSIFPITGGQIAIMNICVNGQGMYNPSNPVKNVKPTFDDMFKWEALILYPIIVMLVIGVLGWVLLYLRVREATVMIQSVESMRFQDRDVAALDELSNDTNLSGIRVSRLKKSFKNDDGSEKHAVQGVSIAIQADQTFGLLGPNGAGKTQVMKMATGCLKPDSGTIVLGDGTKTLEEFFATGKCGYVPQVDLIWNEATVEHHLNFALQVRGIDRESAKDHLDAVIDGLGLRIHLHKKAKALSGGYKRKLCLAIAIVGAPEVLFLDEVSTGMDPGARSSLWSILKPKHRKVPLPAILLSTHYMDEAEYLSNTIGILVDGNLVTAGSIDTLSEKHCTFNIIEANLDITADLDASIELLLSKLPEGVELSEAVNKQVTFKVPRNASVSQAQELGILFNTMEANKEAAHVVYYSCSRMSLEQIFMEQCKEQFNSPHAK